MSKNKKIEETETESLVVEKAIMFDAGNYTGIINGIEKETRYSKKDNTSYTYLDIYFKVKDDLPNIKIGFNWKLSEQTHLGKFLTLSGFKLVEGENVTLAQIKKHLLFKKCSFVVFNDGNFARISEETIKFI
jgi:hypothetical protein